MTNTSIQLDVLVNGKPLREYPHEGKTFIESREGTEYALRVKNQTSGRVLAVISVDGINIISGKAVTDAATESGYVLGPWEEQTLKGYRVDEKTVASFKFVKRGESYATEKGEGQGNGVIAVRAFREKEDLNAKIKALQDAIDKKPAKEYVFIDRPYPVYPYRRPYYYGDYYYCGGNGLIGSAVGRTDTTFSCSAGNTQTAANNNSGVLRAMNCSMQASLGETKCAAEPQSFDMGSGWGKSQSEAIREVEFEAGSLLAELVLFYASLESLKAMGVEVSREKAVAFPEPFKRGFASPPKGWKA